VTRSNNTMTSYTYGPSPQALRTITINTTYTVVAHDFMPNSTVVWGVLKNNTTGAHLFSVLFDAQPPVLAPMEYAGDLTTAEQISVIGFDATEPGPQILTGSVSPPAAKTDPGPSKSETQNISPAPPANVPSAESRPLVFPAIEPNLQPDHPPIVGAESPSQMPSVEPSSDTAPSTEKGTPAAKPIDLSNQKLPEQTVAQTPAPSAVPAQPQPSVNRYMRPIIRSGPRVAATQPPKRPLKKKSRPIVSQKKG
jgi:hypothetical protein